MQHIKPKCLRGRSAVSILTRPEGRVQPANSPNTTYPDAVSILTRPEGRVQRVGGAVIAGLRRVFQSSPGQKAGCNTTTWAPRRKLRRFQSSPGQKAGCNCGICGVRETTTVGFNPHPARRPGATFGGRFTPIPKTLFQSSPGQKAGCNRRPAGPLWLGIPAVSILTRPEGRVQQSAGQDRRHVDTVSILTRPEGRVQRHGIPSVVCPAVVSILTRPSGRVQPRQWLGQSGNP